MSNPLPTLTVSEWIDLGTAKLEQAGVWFGHGTDNARDEAAELVFFAAGLRHEDAASGYQQLVSEAQAARIGELFEKRIAQRVPAAYLTHRMWFGGHEFYVDERALVPRS